MFARDTTQWPVNPWAQQIINTAMHGSGHTLVLRVASSFHVNMNGAQLDRGHVPLVLFVRLPIEIELAS
jgi:hypothetical protein